jgi:hypothetical protein
MASAMTTMALSAIGSIMRPKSLSTRQARASLPSSQSVTAALTNSSSAAASAAGRSKAR